MVAYKKTDVTPEQRAKMDHINATDKERRARKKAGVALAGRTYTTKQDVSPEKRAKLDAINASAKARRMRRKYDGRSVDDIQKAVVAKLMSSVMSNVMLASRNRFKRRVFNKEHPEKNREVHVKYCAKRKKEGRAPISTEAYRRNKNNPEWMEAKRRKERRYQPQATARELLRKKTDLEFAIKKRCRDRARAALKSQGVRKSSHTFDDIGCTAAELKLALRQRMPDGHEFLQCELDHVFPMTSFTLAEDDQRKKANNVNNMQMLTPAENQSKSCRLPTKAMAARVPKELWPPGITEDTLPDIYDGWATPLRMH